MDRKSDFLYERYRLDELTDRERRDLESDPEFEARMAALGESDSDILERYPADRMAELIRQKAGHAPQEAADDKRIVRFRKVRWAAPLAAAAALAIAILAFFPGGAPDRDGGTTDTVRPKGVEVPDSISTPELNLYRSGTNGVEVLQDGDAAAEHDLLQVGFTGGGAWWGAILSVDGNGVVTRHWPLEGDDAVPLGNTSEYLLPYSYELDGAPDFEAFFLVWSDAAFDVIDAEKLLGAYTGRHQEIRTDSLNPTGKTGMTVIQVLKSP